MRCGSLTSLRKCMSIPRLGSSPAALAANAITVIAAIHGFVLSRTMRGRLFLEQKSSRASEVSFEMCLERVSSPAYIPYSCTSFITLDWSMLLTLNSTASTLDAANADSTACGSGYRLLSPIWMDPSRYTVLVDDVAFHIRERRAALA